MSCRHRWNTVDHIERLCDQSRAELGNSELPIPTGRKLERKITHNVPFITTFIHVHLDPGRQRANLLSGERCRGEMTQGEKKVTGDRGQGEKYLATGSRQLSAPGAERQAPQRLSAEG